MAFGATVNSGNGREFRTAHRKGALPRSRRPFVRQTDYERSCVVVISNWRLVMSIGAFLFLAMSFTIPCQPQQDRGDMVLAKRAQEALQADLFSLRGGPQPAQLQQRVDHIFALAERTHEPKRASVEGFANSLANALKGRSLTRASTAGIANVITRVMQSAGTSTVGFFNVVGEFKSQLARSWVPDVQAGLVSEGLERVGKEVRGPEGAPVRQPRRQISAGCCDPT
jgi:hypothetical protein